MLPSNLHPERPRRPSARRLAVAVSLLTACSFLALAASAYAWFPPSNTSPPTVTGTAQQGQTLTEHHGEWMNFPTGYSYQWLRCNSSGASCASISGASGEAYVPVAEDVGHKLRVAETAFNPGGSSAPEDSEATAVVVPPVPVDSTVPTISGTAQQGQTLTESHGTWSNSPTAYTYRWMRCTSTGTGCVAIGGATNQTYSPIAEDVGHKLRVTETASNAGGSGSAAESKVTAVVVPPVPVDSKVPTITGTAQQGQTLTESHGTWSNSPTGYALQWLRCEALGGSCLPISGATGETYSPVAEDVGHDAACDRDGEQRRRFGQCGRIGGDRRGGTAGARGLDPPDGHGYRPAGSDVDREPRHVEQLSHRVRVSVAALQRLGLLVQRDRRRHQPDLFSGVRRRRSRAACDRDGEQRRRFGSAAESAATAVVVPPVPVDSAVPTITGTAQQGQTLTESHGTWSNSPTAYVYQWLRCNASGSSCSAIGGATNQTYSPVSEDVGHELRVTETASNAGGSGSAAESAATAVVVPPVPVDSTVPTITGTAQQGQTLTESHGTWSNSPTATCTSGCAATPPGRAVSRSAGRPTRPILRCPKTSVTSCV